MVESLGWNRLCYDAAAYTQRDVLVKVAFTIYIQDFFGILKFMVVSTLHKGQIFLLNFI